MRIRLTIKVWLLILASDIWLKVLPGIQSVGKFLEDSTRRALNELKSLPAHLHVDISKAQITRNYQLHNKHDSWRNRMSEIGLSDYRALSIRVLGC